VRIASGQRIPEIDANMDEEGGEREDGAGKGMMSPNSEAGQSEESNTITSPVDTPDVADRAAALLEGLQGGGLSKDTSLSVRRRRESAEADREKRRRRRQQASSAKSEDGGLLSPTIKEENEEGEERRGSVFSTDSAQPTTPTTVVHPPSPEQKRDRELPTPPPE